MALWTHKSQINFSLVRIPNFLALRIPLAFYEDKSIEKKKYDRTLGFYISTRNMKLSCPAFNVGVKFFTEIELPTHEKSMSTEQWPLLFSSF